MSTLPFPSEEGNSESIVVIPISKGQHAIVDPEDADLANMKWHLNSDRYAMRRPRIDGKKVGIFMHRVILERKLGRPILPNMVVDHINGEGLDNRRANLREFTWKENALNRRKSWEIKPLVIPEVSLPRYRLDENDPTIGIISINQGKAVLVDIVDIDLADVRWTLNSGRYARRRIEKKGEGKHVSMHRVILERKLGRSIAPDMVVDHINGNGLDNRRANLREATQAQNLRNLRLRSDNISQYKGVSRVNSQTWKAVIQEEVIGYFDVALDASFAYDKAALERYGEFAFLNNPLEQVQQWIPPLRQFGRKNINGYRGVFVCGKRWGAKIKYENQEISLGFFDTVEDAAFAYDKAALDFYGKSAHLNHAAEQVFTWAPPERRLRKSNTSGYRGIKRKGKRWIASIRANGKDVHLGMFDTPEAAAQAYDAAAVKAYGERAILNFPGEGPGAQTD